MADPDEEDKISDIHSPEDLPRKTRYTESIAVLTEVGNDCPQYYSSKYKDRKVERLSRLPDVFQQNRVFFGFPMYLIHHVTSNKNASSQPPQKV